jgi:DNA-binding IscR family transcriptional regulator
MQISKKFTIAIHLLTASRYFEGQQKITSRFLAGSIGTNPVIVRNIMLQLQEAGLIDVKRGPGGITLSRPLSKITYLDIYKAVETNSQEDLFHFHENPSPLCPVGKKYPSGVGTIPDRHSVRFRERSGFPHCRRSVSQDCAGTTGCLKGANLYTYFLDTIVQISTYLHFRFKVCKLLVSAVRNLLPLRRGDTYKIESEVVRT